jgi:hypothetical protein
MGGGVNKTNWPSEIFNSGFKTAEPEVSSLQRKYRSDCRRLFGWRLGEEKGHGELAVTWGATGAEPSMEEKDNVSSGSMLMLGGTIRWPKSRGQKEPSLRQERLQAIIWKWT